MTAPNRDDWSSLAVRRPVADDVRQLQLDISREERKQPTITDVLRRLLDTYRAATSTGRAAPAPDTNGSNNR